MGDYFIIALLHLTAFSHTAVHYIQLYAWYSITTYNMRTYFFGFKSSKWCKSKRASNTSPTVFATWQELLSLWKALDCSILKPVDTQYGLLHLSICLCECVYLVITVTWTVVSQWQHWMHGLTVHVCICVVGRKSALIAHILSWFCVHKTISTTQGAFRISAVWYGLAERAFTCIVNNDGGSSRGWAGSLPHKTWEREGRLKEQNRVWKHPLFVFPA